MASLLRSCKFVRLFASFTRNLAFGGTRQDAFEASPAVTGNPNLYAGLAIRALATQTSSRHDSSLERSLRRLDQDARRAGRISRRELDEVIEEIKQTRSATSTQSLMVIRCCGSLVPEELPEVRTKLVQEIWNTLEGLGVPMDISHYNALLRVYLENEHAFSPTEFLAELERKGVEPNRVTYQRLVARHCQQGDMEGAARVLQIMRDQQMPVNESVFNALVMGHARSGDMESARGILGVMKQAGLEPGAETYTALLCGHAQQGDMEALRAVLAECETQQVDLLDRDLLAVIHSLAVAGHTQHITEIIGHLKRHIGYNQDCVNLVLRLVNDGQEAVGLQLLRTMTQVVRTSEDGSPQENMPSGGFFIKQLVKANKSMETIVSICKQMQEQQLHPRALLVAMEAALTFGRHDTTLALASAIKEQGLPLRPHYFWPLLAQHCKTNNSQGICDVLRHMQTVGVIPNGETLREYAIPGLADPPEQKVSSLRAAGISAGSAVASLVISLLQSNKIQAAADLVIQYKANYPYHLVRRSLVQAFVASPNVPALLQIIQAVMSSERTVPEAGEEDVEGESAERQSGEQNLVAGNTGAIVFGCIKGLTTGQVETLQAILEGLMERGLSISAVSAEQLQEHIGAELTPEVSTLLSKLTSGTLVPQTLAYDSNAPPMNIRDLENLLKTMESRGQKTLTVKRQLLVHYCRSRDLEKAEEIKKSLDAEGFVYSAGSLAQLLELYAVSEKLPEALDMLKQLKEREPEFRLDFLKALRLADLLIKNGRLQEGVELLNSLPVRDPEKQPARDDGITFTSRAQTWRMLNFLAEEGRIDDLQLVFDAIIRTNEIPINNVVLGPLIKVHILKDDMKAALDRFEWCCTEHHVTPWKNELACRLIQQEDATSLQRLTDLSTQVHGEVNSLYDLVLAFVECGRVRQARRILETPGLRSRSYRLSAACQRFSEEGQVASLEGLMEATRDLNHIDRENIYQHLLTSYCKSGDVEKALGLWTQAQEEDVQPSDQFLFMLGNLLKANNQPVPFAMPENPAPPAPVAPEPARPDRTTSRPVAGRTPRGRARPAAAEGAVSEELQTLRLALRTKDVDKALAMNQILETKERPLSVRDSSLLVEMLVGAERVGEALRVTLQMLGRGTHPLPRVFRFLLNRLALTGDVDALGQIGKHLDDEKKKLVSYDNRLCNAHLVAGRAAEYIQNLKAALEKSKTPEEIAVLSASFPRGGALGVLEKHPELVPEFTELANKYAEHGELGPINVLWMHMFVNGQRDEARDLWERHLSSCPRLMFQWVCQVARRTAAPTLAADLFALLACNNSASAGAKGNALSCLLDVLCSEQRYEEALASLTAAQKDVSLEYVNRTALLRIQSGLQEQGKTFPFTIPSKSASKAVNSSGSDEDEERRS